MNKLYTLFAFLVCFFGFGPVLDAQVTTEDIPLTLCINIDQPSLCYVMDANYQPMDLQQGENVFTVIYHQTTYTDGETYGYSDMLYLNIRDEYTAQYNFSACDLQLTGAPQAVPYEYFRGPSSRIAISMEPDMDGCVFFPTIVNMDQLRTASATVNVDDASNVRIRCGYTGYYPELVNGENIIRFNPETEAYWEIGPAEYNTYLGGVTLNGQEVESRYGIYDLYVTDGAVIDIIGQANLEPVKVTFSFVNSDTEAAVKGVYKYINYTSVEVENWQEGFSVEPYTQLIVSLNQNAYCINSLTVNGVAEQIYADDVYITITKDSEIAVDATAYSTFDFVLTVTDPAHLDIAVAESMYAGSTPLVGLVPGTQTVTVSDKNQYLLVNAIDGCVIDRIAYVEKGSTEAIEVEAGYSGYYVPLTNTESVTILSHAMVRDNTATLWVNDISKCYVLSLKYADGSYIFDTYSAEPAVTGEQTFFFDATEDNPVWLFFSPIDYDNPGFVMLNEQIIEPKYEGTATYEFDVKDGDVIKVYIGEVPPSTSINSISVETQDQAVYTITGIKTDRSNMVPGIYIVGGKKILVK